MFRSAILSLFLVSMTVLAAENWPQFRGPQGDGHAKATQLPTRWSETENVVWKTAIHDKGWSSPVIWGDQIWVTTATDTGTKYYAVGLDRKSGKVLHDIHLFDETDPPNIKQYNSYASPTPAIEAGRLYAHFGSHGTACIDTQSGNILWKQRDLPCDHFRGPASSPVIWNDRLFLLFDGFDQQYVTCLDKKTGKPLWRTDRNLPYRDSGRPKTDNDYKKAYATPSIIVVDGQPQLVAPAAMGTVAYDPETGRELWRVIHDGMNEASRPVYAHGLVYVTAGSLSTILAFRPGGTGDITNTNVVWKLARSAPTRPSPLVVGDYLYMVNDTGTVQCLEAKTGKVIWKETLDGKFSASPIFADGLIYFFNEAGKGFVVAASPEHKLIEMNRLDQGCRASPAAVDRHLFVRTETHLYCLGKK